MQQQHYEAATLCTRRQRQQQHCPAHVCLRCRSAASGRSCMSMAMWLRPISNSRSMSYRGVSARAGRGDADDAREGGAGQKSQSKGTPAELLGVSMPRECMCQQYDVTGSFPAFAQAHLRALRAWSALSSAPPYVPGPCPPSAAPAVDGQAVGQAGRRERIQSLGMGYAKWVECGLK